MKRREFLQAIGKGAAAVVGYFALPKEVPAKQGKDTDDVQEWPAVEMLDFSPDSIVRFQQIDGRLIAFCEHSIWEIRRDCYDYGWERAQRCFEDLRSIVDSDLPIVKVEYNPWDSTLFVYTDDNVYVAALIKRDDGTLSFA